MAIQAGETTFYQAKRGIVQDGLVFNIDAAVKDSFNSVSWDDIKGGKSGTLVNMSSSNFNKEKGGVLDFDGTDEYVTFGTSDALITQDASVSTWIYTRANSGRVISHNWNFTYNEFGWAVHLGSSNWSAVTNQASATWMSSDNAANYNASACVQSNASSIPLNQWFNLTITKSGANVSIYLDNSLIKTGTVPSSIAYAGSASNKTLVIGTNIFDFYVDFFGDEFNGRIGSINIYNRALTSDEIARNYNATRHRFGV